MKSFALCFRAISRNESMAIHRAGCSDIERREVRKHDATVTLVACADVAAALDALLDADLLEMGYSAEHVKVYPCCQSAPELTPAPEHSESHSPANPCSPSCKGYSK